MVGVVCSGHGVSEFIAVADYHGKWYVVVKSPHFKKNSLFQEYIKISFFKFHCILFLNTSPTATRLSICYCFSDLTGDHDLMHWPADT